MLTLEKSPGTRQSQQQESGGNHPGKVSSAVGSCGADTSGGSASSGCELRSPSGRQRLRVTAQT